MQSNSSAFLAAYLKHCFLVFPSDRRQGCWIRYILEGPKRLDKGRRDAPHVRHLLQDSPDAWLGLQEGLAAHLTNLLWGDLPGHQHLLQGGTGKVKRHPTKGRVSELPT